LRPRKLALLFLLLGFGALVETAYSLKTRMVIGPMGCRVLTGRFQGPSYSFESEETRTGVPAELALSVENAFGEVRVWRGEPGQVKLRLRKVVFLPTEEKAREMAAKLSPSLTLQGTTLRVTTNRRELEQGSDVGIETHISLEVPPDTRVRIQNEHGAASVADAREASVWSSYEAVRVERIAGAAEIDNRHGDAFASQIGADLKLTTRYGNVEVKDVAQKTTLQLEHGDARLTGIGALDATLRYSDLVAEGVRGELSVEGRHASVKASDVKGRALVDTSYRNVELRTIGADVRVKTEHGALSAEGLAGALSAEVTYDDVDARDVAGPVEVRASHGGFKGSGLKQGARVKTSGDDVELRAFEGVIDVETQRGAVRLYPDKPLLESVTVTTLRGGIQLEVPAGSRFELDASARRGEVQANVPELQISESSSARLKASLGKGGNSVTLRTEHGDISVETRTSAAAK
jgi:DUF4097 and DUF4098 domain-containing protein YvlB